MCGSSSFVSEKLTTLDIGDIWKESSLPENYQTSSCRFFSRGDFSLIITIGNSGFIFLLLVSNYIICDPITKNMFFIGFAPQITFSLWFDVNLRDELLCMHAFYHSLFSTINWSVRKNCVKQRRDQFRAKQSLMTLFCILYTEYIVYSECIVYHRVW